MFSKHFTNVHISIHSLRMEGDLLVEFREQWRRISIHSLRMEGDNWIFCKIQRKTLFQSTPSVWRETRKAYNVRWQNTRFQSTPSVWRETVFENCNRCGVRNFNPLPPYGGRHYQCCMADLSKLFQSTPSVWRETKTDPQSVRKSAFQSTPSVWRETNVTVFAPFAVLKFQSTPSVWRETLIAGVLERYQFHFNPLPPYGGRPV